MKPGLWITVLLAGCGFTTIRGSGVIASEDREVEAFDAVVTEAVVDVTVALGTPRAVTLICDDNLLGLIFTDVVDGALIVSTRREGRIAPTGDCIADIVTPALVALQSSGSGNAEMTSPAVGVADFRTSGSGDVTAGAVQADTVTADASGAGAIGLTGIDAGHVDASVSGSGSITLGGAADSADLSTSGSGSIRARELVVQTVTASSSGSGGIQITAEASVDAHTSGSGDIEVWGDPPDVQTDELGSGQVILR